MTSNGLPGWEASAQQWGKSMADSWQRALDSFQQIDLGTGAAGQLSFAPDKLRDLQADYLKEATSLWNQGLTAASPLKDRRFSGDAWAQNPVAAFTAATYLLNSRTLMSLTDALEADDKTRSRIRFAVEQWVAASAPSNFLAFNAEAQKKALETHLPSLKQFGPLPWS